MEFKLQEFTASVATSVEHQSSHWGVAMLNAPEAWKITKGKGVRVAILDTGIDFSHPDLAPNLRGGVNFTTGDSTDFMDRNGHGTHCAGIVAACDNETGVVGIAPEADLYAVKVLNDNGSGRLDWIVRGIEWCIANKMDVISMSLGVEKEPPQFFHEVIKRARQAGIIIIVAAGNESHYIDWPAKYPETIAVGAIDSQRKHADFSNFGTDLDISAPGVGIFSTYPVSQYATLSGTSMATPIVAGAIALFIADRRNEKKAYSFNDLYDALAKSAQDLGFSGYDAETGYGLVNLVGLLNS